MDRLFRVLIQVDKLIDNEFKRIISLERICDNEEEIEVIVTNYHSQVSEFVDKLIKGTKNATKNPLTQ